MRINEPLHLHVTPLYHLASMYDEFTLFDLEHAVFESLYEYCTLHLTRSTRSGWRERAEQPKGLGEISQIVEVSYRAIDLFGI